jgi:hypothetical protein
LFCVKKKKRKKRIIMVVELQSTSGTEQGKGRRNQTYANVEFVGINQNLKPTFSDL